MITLNLIIFLDTRKGCSSRLFPACVTHTYGLLHRLDIPSSGLVLAAKTCEAYYDLQLQLSIGDLVRDYVVLCHGLLPSSCQEINERVYFWCHEGNLPSIVCRKGTPSLTWLKVVAHCSREAEDFSLVAIRIRTGRRHQIRTHMMHIGHPIVCDGKYTNASVFLKDMEWCERNFLHRYRLSFFDQDGDVHEAMTPLPSDLVQALASLVPHTTESAVALREWMSGAALGGWAKFAQLGDANR